MRSALRVAGRTPSVTVHTKTVGTLYTLVHEGTEGWGHQHNLLHLSLSCPAFLAGVALFYNLLHSRPAPLYINYALGAEEGLITS